MPAPNTKLTTLTVFLGVTVAAWLAIDWVYQAQRIIGGVPLIRAEAGPVKQRPPNRGGMPVPNQNMLVWELLKSTPPPPRKVTLAPLPEEPIELPKRLAAKSEEPVLPKDQASWIKDLEVSEVYTELRRLRLAFNADQSSGAN